MKHYATLVNMIVPSVKQVPYSQQKNPSCCLPPRALKPASEISTEFTRKKLMLMIIATSLYDRGLKLKSSFIFASHETHKIGVLYVGPNQATNEVAILGNNFGSLRYTDFLNGLGRLISLHDVDKAATYLGGLDTADGDGDFAYMWEDDVMQVQYWLNKAFFKIENIEQKSNFSCKHQFYCLV